MFILEDFRGSHQPDRLRREQLLGIAPPERLQLLYCLKQFRRNLFQIEFGVDFQNRLEIGGGQSLPRVSLQMSAKFCYSLRGERKADGVRMSPIACEELAAGLEG